MALQPVVVRLEPDVVEAVAREATRKGVSSAVFMRTAIVFRLGYCHGERGDGAEHYQDEEQTGEE